MNAPVRKPVVPAEATQELQAADVIEVLGTKVTAKSGVTRRPLGSQSSIAPVGLDLAVGAGDDEEDRGVTGHVFMQAPRKRFKGLVIAVVSGCALILVAAGVARVVHASDEPSRASAGAPITTSQPSTPSTTTPTTTAAPAFTSPASAAAAPVTMPDGTSSGTVRLDRPAKVGHVWLDGKKITSPSALVSCGTHRIKVGHGRTHSIDVPCGGEIAVSK
ncbi:MAG TPA: hypothetical protein VF765_32345 [Polyangiaceae bacterium]